MDLNHDGTFDHKDHLIYVSEIAPKRNEVGKVRSQSGKVSQKGKTESRSSYGGIAIMLVIFLIYVIIKVVGN